MLNTAPPAGPFFSPPLRPLPTPRTPASLRRCAVGGWVEWGCGTGRAWWLLVVGAGKPGRHAPASARERQRRLAMAVATAAAAVGGNVAGCGCGSSGGGLGCGLAAAAAATAAAVSAVTAAAVAAAAAAALMHVMQTSMPIDEGHAAHQESFWNRWPGCRRGLRWQQLVNSWCGVAVEGRPRVASCICAHAQSVTRCVG